MTAIGMLFVVIGALLVINDGNEKTLWGFIGALLFVAGLISTACGVFVFLWRVLP